ATERRRESRTPALPERLALLESGRMVHFFQFVSPHAYDWYRNVHTAQRGVADKLWFEIPDFLPEQGDLRTLWDASRGAWAIDLARAASHNIASDAGAIYWRLLESWLDACPPFVGVQWKCGQEASTRLIALAFGLWAVADDPATTPERWQKFARLAWVTGYRVRHHIDYAISQKNNHSLSEACGLILVSQLFPEFRESAEWRACGKRVITQELARQVYADGSYVQQSTNYHRVMLNISVVAARLCELAGDPLERSAIDKIAAGSEFLFQLMDPTTGQLPNYGSNDGALVLPLSECGFPDFRPSIQAAHYLARREKLLPDGPWDEDLVWLFGPDALTGKRAELRSPVSSAFDAGGYYTLRNRESCAMTRCHTYRDRPAHVDMLHVDLWWRGQNMLQDCGSYQYFTPENKAVEKHFKSIAAHNTIELDGQSPLELVSRFLWFPWPRAVERDFEGAIDGPLYFEGESHAYARSPWRCVHRRAIIGLDDDTWVIVDDVLGRGSHTARARWHLLDAPYRLEPVRGCVTLDTLAGQWSIACAARQPLALRVDRGVEDATHLRGFSSRVYSHRFPIPVVEATLHGPLPLRIVTLCGPGSLAAPRLLSTTGECEYWQTRDGQHERTLVLARPDRLAQRTLIEIRDAQAGRK
ncbi:MAG: alginate lyase family protein, partial [Phycisphaerae bacterium]